MLVTLNSTLALESEVVDVVDDWSTDVTPEAMSDPDLMETLKVDIAELKNMVTTAQADVDAYKAEKEIFESSR